jgi:diguanylate cyclase (GGDEF)-like protein
MTDFSERSLTASYLAALGLIALLTVVSHATLDRVLAEHEGSASVINISGRQRMLSQRIASLAAQYRLGSPTAKADMMVAIDRFEAAHHKLVLDTGTTDLSMPAGAALRTLYFSGDSPLDGEVGAYVSLARHIVENPPSAPQIDGELSRLFEEARSPLLEKLNQVVALHQQNSEAQMSRLQWLQHLTLGVVLITLLTEALLIFRPMVRRITRYAAELLRMATTDQLTGILNRHSFFERGAIEIARAHRSGRPTSVLMLDADHFKQVNDRFGHAGGDAALRSLAETLRRLIRPGDLLARLGGEEFAVLLPETPQDAASQLAERLRAAVAGQNIAFAGQNVRLTTSIGVAAAVGASADLNALLHSADMALYAAKAGGRNRVAINAHALLEAV